LKPLSSITKSQIPNSKAQINLKHEFQMTKTIFCLEFRIWILEFVCYLMLACLPGGRGFGA
jgi:hypothetical protein